MYRIWIVSWIFVSCVLARRRRSLQTKTLPGAQKQFANCNNCYAVVAYDVLKYHKPSLNISISTLMEDSQQSCAGGSATKIWDLFMSSTVTTANIPKLIRLLRNGPLAISSEKGHLVTAISASKHGVLIRDPVDAKTKVLEHKTFFDYVAYVTP
jgi:hypothetical protein